LDYFITNGGIWKDKPIVAVNWVNASLQPHVERPEGRRKAGGYGYQFWLWNDMLNDKQVSMVACVGKRRPKNFY
jgi:hypothetical protein